MIVSVHRPISGVLRGLYDAGLVVIEDHVTHALERHLNPFALLDMDCGFMPMR
jgi:hypothetical protein